MASRRELIESEDFQRRRGVAALVRGDTLAIEDVPRRPNVAIVVGLVVVVLVAAGSAATAFLTGRAPDGWRDDGALVVDRDTGARYLAQDGALRPVPALTAALLAGARAAPIVVTHRRVLDAPVGRPLPADGLPESPPTIPAAQPPLAACATARDAVAVFTGAPGGDASDATGVLARAPGAAETLLVTGGRVHRLDPDALPALGWSPTQVRELPAAWLALLPRGGTLAPLAAPGAVVATPSGARFVLDRGRARLVADATSARLLPAPTRTVPLEEVQRLPSGPVIGLPDVPSAPPRVPSRDDDAVPCVVGGGSGDPRLTVVGGQGGVRDTATTRPAPERILAGDGGGLHVTWHVAPDGGALIAPPEYRADVSGAARPDDEGVVLAAAGIGFPVADDEALRALGYARSLVLPVPRAWFALLAAGPRLATPPH